MLGAADADIKYCLGVPLQGRFKAWRSRVPEQKRPTLATIPDLPDESPAKSRASAKSDTAPDFNPPPIATANITELTISAAHKAFRKRGLTVVFDPQWRVATTGTHHFCPLTVTPRIEHPRRLFSVKLLIVVRTGFSRSS